MGQTPQVNNFETNEANNTPPQNITSNMATFIILLEIIFCLKKKKIRWAGRQLRHSPCFRLFHQEIHETVREVGQVGGLFRQGTLPHGLDGWGPPMGGTIPSMGPKSHMFVEDLTNLGFCEVLCFDTAHSDIPAKMNGISGIPFG